jgi:hypothetical protein
MVIYFMKFGPQLGVRVLPFSAASVALSLPQRNAPLSSLILFNNLQTPFSTTPFLSYSYKLPPGGGGPKAKPRRKTAKFRSDVPTFRRSNALTSLECYPCAIARTKCNGITSLCKNIGGWGPRSESRLQTSPDSVKLDFPGGAAYFLRQAQHSQ